MCSYEIRSRPCSNPSNYRVDFTTPDDGKAMRQRTFVLRCYWHRDAKFLPEGATQIEWSNYSSPTTAGEP